MIYKRIKYWLLIVFLSVKWMFKINLGDTVIYQGKRWTAIQGVCNPVWDIVRIGSNEKATIDKKYFRKELTVGNLVGSFKSGYRFYMTCWYRIFVNSGIQPWMRNCNIWGK